MRAIDYNINKKLRHKVTKEIYEIENVDGEIMWVNQWTGDVFSYLDEDLLDDLDYYK